MNIKEIQSRFLNKTTLAIAGILLILLTAIFLLWQGKFKDILL